MSPPRPPLPFSLAPCGRALRWVLLFACGLALAGGATRLGAQTGRTEKLPPKPARHFNDYANVVSPSAERTLDARLAQFERDTSSQILVAVFARRESASSIEDYAVRVAESWKVGQQKQDNGAVLFVFMESRELSLQVGYGLEGALTDALSFQIIENEIKPRFRAGDIDGGLAAGVNAILAATRGEYRGTGRTQAERAGVDRGGGGGGFPGVFFIVVFFVIVSALRQRRGGQRVLGNPRRYGRHDDLFPPRGGGFGGFGGGGGFGGFGGGGGGGFSGGGGSFGGGGASGKW